MMFAAGETVTRLRATAKLDRSSGEMTGADWISPSTLVILGCAFDPGTSTEPLERGRDAVLTQPTVYAPAGSDVLAGDRLVVRGRTWEVDGDPGDFRSPFTGWHPGVAIALKAVSG